MSDIEGDDEIEIVRYDDRAALIDAVRLANAAVGVGLPDDMAARLTAGEERHRRDDRRRKGVMLGAYQSLVRMRSRKSLIGDSDPLRRRKGRGPRGRGEAAVADLVDAVPAINIVNDRGRRVVVRRRLRPVQIGATSQLVLFMFLTGLTGSAALIQSKRLGVTRRMLARRTGA